MSFDPKQALQQRQEQTLSQSWLRRKLHEFNSAHNRLKHNVHTAWRYPLPPWGRALMGCFYFSIPVVLGYAVSTWAVAQSEATVDERFGNKGNVHEIQGLGDKTVFSDGNGEKRMQKIGAGGWGGGVHLVTSDKETADVNKKNLERFLKEQRRLKKKREKEAAST